jgi:Uma2 family endonuclease
MTLVDYFNTPETVLPQELVDGVMFVREAPSVHHQRSLFRLGVALQAHADVHSAGEILLAPVDIVLDSDRPLVVQPDLLFVGTARAHIVKDRVYGAPDLVVEILSPDCRIGRLDERVGWFAEYGVREIWLYHQSQERMEVLQCDAGRVAARKSFWPSDRVDSRVLPPMTQTLGAMLNVR